MVAHEAGLLITLVIFLAVFALLAKAHNPLEEKKKGKVVVISFDGFRHDYISKAAAAGRNVSIFQRLIREGVHAQTVRNCFITATFPNHFSIATGLYEESHGIVDNNFYDPSLKLSFPTNDGAAEFQSKWWDVGAEPIWITNEAQGRGHSAVFHWIGSSSFFRDQLPRYNLGAYSSQMPLNYKMRSFTHLLDVDPKVNLGMLYWHEPDKSGHMFGPDSAQVMQQIELLNTALDRFLHYLQTRWPGQVNLIITSDHGMTQLSPNRVVVLNDTLLSSSLFNETQSHLSLTRWSLWPLADDIDGKNLLKTLRNLHLPNIQVVTRSEMPADWHYQKNRRTPPVLLLPDKGWVLLRSDKEKEKFTNRGDHGYSNNESDMQPFLVAWGPRFLRNVTVPIVHTVDLYALMCYLLDLRAAPNNGSLSRIKSLLLEDDENEVLFLDWTLGGTLLAILLVVTITCAFIIGLVHSLFTRKQTHKHLRIEVHKSSSLTHSTTQNHHESLVHLMDDNSDSELLNEEL